MFGLNPEFGSHQKVRLKAVAALGCQYFSWTPRKVKLVFKWQWHYILIRTNSNIGMDNTIELKLKTICAHFGYWSLLSVWSAFSTSCLQVIPSIKSPLTLSLFIITWAESFFIFGNESKIINLNSWSKCTVYKLCWEKQIVD